MNERSDHSEQIWNVIPAVIWRKSVLVVNLDQLWFSKTNEAEVGSCCSERKWDWNICCSFQTGARWMILVGPGTDWSFISYAIGWTRTDLVFIQCFSFPRQTNSRSTVLQLEICEGITWKRVSLPASFGEFCFGWLKLFAPCDRSPASSSRHLNIRISSKYQEVEKLCTEIVRKLSVFIYCCR